MKRLTAIFISSILMISMIPVKAQNDTKLVGVWLLTDAKVDGKTPAPKGCYLCDLYDRRGSLEFTAGGLAHYTGNTSSRDVHYITDGNKLVMSLHPINTFNIPNAGNNTPEGKEEVAKFEYSISGNTLTLTMKPDKGTTEVYTFTK